MASGLYLTASQVMMMLDSELASIVEQVYTLTPPLTYVPLCTDAHSEPSNDSQIFGSSWKSCPADCLTGQPAANELKRVALISEPSM